MVEDNYGSSSCSGGRGLSRGLRTLPVRADLVGEEASSRLIDRLGGISDAVQSRKALIFSKDGLELALERPGRRRPGGEGCSSGSSLQALPAAVGDLLMWLHRAPHQALALCPQLSEFRVEEDLLGWLRLLQRGSVEILVALR